MAWGSLQNRQISKPTDERAYCALSIDFDKDNTTPVLSNLRFKCYNNQTQFDLPVRVLYNYSDTADLTETNYNKFFHLKGSGSVSDTTEFIETKYTNGTQAWANRSNSLTITKDMYADKWLLPAMLICLDADPELGLNAKNIREAYQAAKKQKVIRFDDYSTRDALYSHIESELGIEYVTNLDALYDSLFDVEEGTVIFLKGWQDCSYDALPVVETFEQAATEYGSSHLVIIRQEYQSNLYPPEHWWPAIDNFILVPPAYVITTAIAKPLVGTPTINFIDNGDNTYSFSINGACLQGGSSSDKMTWQPVGQDVIKYTQWERGKEPKTVTKTFSYSATTQPTSSSRCSIGPISMEGMLDSTGTAYSNATVTYSCYSALDLYNANPTSTSQTYSVQKYDPSDPEIPEYVNGVRTLDTWKISKPNDANSYCMVDFVMDEASITPVSAKVGFRAYNFTKDFKVPVHVLVNDKYYLRIAESIDSGDRSTATDTTVWQYSTGADDWWGKDTTKKDLTIRKDPFSASWDLSYNFNNIKFSTNYDGKTATAFAEYYSRGQHELVIDFDSYSDATSLFQTISNHFNTSITSATALRSFLEKRKTTTDIFLMNESGSHGYDAAGIASSIRYAASSNSAYLVLRRDTDSRNPWPLIDDFALLFQLSYSALDAVAANLTGDPAVVFTDNGDNTYSFYFARRAEPGSPNNKKSYHPIAYETITYETWAKNGTREKLTQTYRHDPTSQPSGPTDVIGPITFAGMPYESTGQTTAITYVACGIYDSTAQNPVRKATSHLVAHYTAPPNPKVDNSFCYFNSSRPRASSALYFTWQVPDDTRTVINAPVVGYRVAVYIKRPEDSDYSRFKDLACSCSPSDFSNLTHGWNVVRYRISYLNQGDPLPTPTMPDQKYFRANSDGFIFTDEGTKDTGYTFWNQPLPSRYAGTRFKPDDSNTTMSVDFLNDYYTKESNEESSRTWRGITLDLSTFPPAQRLPVGTKVLLRVTAFSKNGKGARLYSQWDGNTQSAPLASITLEKPSAVLNVYDGSTWQEGLVHVYDGSNWVEAEGLFTYDGSQWIEAII